MRILHVVPTYLPATRYGGPIYSVHGLCVALAQRGHEVTVWTTSVDGPGDSDVPLEVPVMLDGVRVFYHRSRWSRRLFFSPSLSRRLRDGVRGFDLVHLHSVFLWPTLAAARAAAGDGVPYVVSPRGMLVPELIARKSRWIKTAWIQLFERRTLEKAAAVHLTSEIEKQDLTKFDFRLREIFVSPNGVEIPSALPPSASDLPPTVLYVGRINWKKGLKRLIEAMRYVPGARLDIAGNDEEGLRPKLEAQVRRLNLDERVRFLGHVEGERKQNLYRNATVLALPSYSENFGNVVLEAWACGCPVVVTPEVGLADTVRECGGGLVASGEPSVFATALRKILDDHALRRRSAAAGREIIARKFTWPVVAAQMEAHYLRILDENQRG